MKLDDSSIVHIAKALQMAMLTGTDIVDHLRHADFCINDNKIFLDPEYKKTFQAGVDKMVEEVENTQQAINNMSIEEKREARSGLDCDGQSTTFKL